MYDDKPQPHAPPTGGRHGSAVGLWLAATWWFIGHHPAKSPGTAAELGYGRAAGTYPRSYGPVIRPQAPEYSRLGRKKLTASIA